MPMPSVHAKHVASPLVGHNALSLDDAFSSRLFALFVCCFFCFFLFLEYEGPRAACPREGGDLQCRLGQPRAMVLMGCASNRAACREADGWTS